MDGILGTFLVAAVSGTATVIFLKTGIARFGMGPSARPSWDFSRTGNPMLYWLIIGICAAITIYAVAVGLHSLS